MRHDRLKKIREMRESTLEDVAARIGISSRQLIRYEGGESDPPASVIAKMATVLGVSSDYLLGIADDIEDVYAESELTSTERELIISLREKRNAEAAEAFAALMKRKN